MLVPSRRDVATYDLAPAMSAEPITDRLEAAVAGGAYGFIVVNYANPDMVGHTGGWDAADRGARDHRRLPRPGEQLRSCAAGGALLITADHGNVERMRDADGGPHTAHTTADVPFVLVGEAWRGRHLRDGTWPTSRRRSAPCWASRSGQHMTGRSLLVDSGRDQ